MVKAAPIAGPQAPRSATVYRAIGGDLPDQCDIMRQHEASFSSPRVMPSNIHSPNRLWP
jgi:hypothetical protein